MGYVYLAKLMGCADIYKIGFTQRTAEARVKALQRYVGPCVLIDSYEATVMRPQALERDLHGIYLKASRITPFGRWPSDELFHLTHDEANSFQKTAKACEDRHRKYLDELEAIDPEDLPALLTFLFGFPQKQ